MIHQTALVHPKAELASDVTVGAYSIIGEQVRIGPGTVIGDHVTISGRTTIGARNHIHGFCSLGGIPQDKKYHGEDTALEIGNDNTIREFCTFNIGTIDDVGVTRLGDHNWIMAYVHLAHDCQVGNHTTFANNATLAGHVRVDDWVILGGFVGVHQFVQVGAHSFLGISAVVTQDVPPYVMLAGHPAAPHGINSEGLRRRGFSAEDVAAIKRAYRKLYRSGLSLEQAREELVLLARESSCVQPMVDFLDRSTRGIVR
ncbi:MAG: acyl-ACP--UDP-N-acetylglucosamine O-acyltransferase [Betaproteobacteria bacterium]|nr:acyl-ACP--UDP-N-acetylglucosamine O-acyltransferase [Betaproteobacteria bacterium]MDE1980821.1 acyl-ACP--UDP-N-acetylglucosamine O-acyltransferase [Betaproteobacteria bacterium]MDE2131917.1 acyl-ACP--UDP-N-acetylglucosamine O-acyltransferase [Betaproteobacteria bacterium]MDE2211590.1 acyl-ACP--UDP-N-acetylglucosamine O-acyltransferase [Betaproteobacteria bacterium]MDE2354840.1 acyl-ACP--UDP-N-acetylglucosamine O-acyltransferase [Betaproteobacteria bacterium]